MFLNILRALGEKANYCSTLAAVRKKRTTLESQTVFIQGSFCQLLPLLSFGQTLTDMCLCLVFKPGIDFFFFITSNLWFLGFSWFVFPHSFYFPSPCDSFSSLFCLEFVSWHFFNLCQQGFLPPWASCLVFISPAAIWSAHGPIRA